MAANTLLAAWGQAPLEDEAKVSESPRNGPTPYSAPIQRKVRGTTTGASQVHPFFAQRISSSSTPKTRVEEAKAKLGTLPAPWPSRDMMHVVPSTDVPSATLTWPRRSRKQTAAMPSTSAPPWARRSAWPTHDTPPILCEASLRPCTTENNTPNALARTPLAFVASDLAMHTRPTPPPVITHLYERLLSQPVRALSHEQPLAEHDALWTDRWRPTCAAHVLGNEEPAIYMRDWLHKLRVTYSGVKARTIQTRVASRKRGRARADSDSEFDADEAEWFEQFRAPSSSTEAAPTNDDVLTNCLVLTGPTGAGKSAAVYACAAELGFEVFEMYPGMGRRSGKELVSAVGHLSRNHMVQREQHQDVPPQSLILLDEVDILFEDDAGFWPAVVELIGESRRPVILTCTDGSTLPWNELPVQRTLTWTPPPAPMASMYLQLVALAEGYIVSQAAMQTLYEQTAPRPSLPDRGSGPTGPTAQVFPWDRQHSAGMPAYDLRAALMQLQWLCLYTRAQHMLTTTPSTTDTCERTPGPSYEARFAALDPTAAALLQGLATMQQHADQLSYLDVIGPHDEYADEYIPLPGRGRAHLAPTPAAPSCGPTLPWSTYMRTALPAALQPTGSPALEQPASLLDRDRVSYCHHVHAMLHLLHVPLTEQLPRASVALEYAPYVREMYRIDTARQNAWAAQLYEAAQAQRMTRNAARLLLDPQAMRGYEFRAWLPFGPSEQAAYRATCFASR
ncbi:ATP binding protein [Malassezia pachydermatis]